MSETTIFENACSDAGLFACDYGTDEMRVYRHDDVTIANGTPCFRHGAAPLFKGSRDDAARFVYDSAARNLRELAKAMLPDVMEAARAIGFAQRYDGYAASKTSASTLRL